MRSSVAPSFSSRRRCPKGGWGQRKVMDKADTKSPKTAQIQPFFVYNWLVFVYNWLVPMYNWILNVYNPLVSMHNQSFSMYNHSLPMYNQTTTSSFYNWLSLTQIILHKINKKKSCPWYIRMGLMFLAAPNYSCFILSSFHQKPIAPIFARPCRRKRICRKK